MGKFKDKVLVSWVGRMTPDGKRIVAEATKAGVTLIDVTAVPRITIAQKLDVLSSQAKIAGHRAIVEATHCFGRFHTAEMTAAGKFPPSSTLVMGCGVAGLAAMGTAKALGSVVKAWDVRAECEDQAKSMGAGWMKVNFKEDGRGEGGYAKESSEEYKKAQMETFRKELSTTDIAVSSAAIPGRPAPTLITKEAIAGMKPGSVIIDLSAQFGGNCELTQKGKKITTENGVIVIGYTDMPARMAMQASAMYAMNMMRLLQHVSGKEKASGFLTKLYKDLDLPKESTEGDIVSRIIVCCKRGAAHDYPPVPQPTPAKPKVVADAKAKSVPRPFLSAFISALTLAAIVAMAVGMGVGVEEKVEVNGNETGNGHVWLLTTFLLSGAAGYQAVWGVAHSLHTPLMAVTNAISGMTAVGGILLFNKNSSFSESSCLAAVAIAISTVNIIGGFIVSQRMLNLFKNAKKDGEADYSALNILTGIVLVVVGIVGSPALEDATTSVSAILCIAAIGALAKQSSAQTGCKFGMVGVMGCLVVTLRALGLGTSFWVIGGLLAVGAVAGIAIGVAVSPMQLPQTVAAFHSLVGLAAMLTSIGSFAQNPDPKVSMETIAAGMGDFIGGVTLTGSLIAFGKLNGNLSSKPLELPGKNFLNLAGFLGFIGMMVAFVTTDDPDMAHLMLYCIALLACIMGWHLVGSVGGGDMPVCITVLNSYSGWALVAEGFLLNSACLTIVGSLIGFSGAILTKIMCDAMNRDIVNVIFGGLYNTPTAKKAAGEKKEHVEASVTSVAAMLTAGDCKNVLCVPGYGMAMSAAQGSMGELARLLRDNDINMTFGIHPVAGRMPGQMNVLLAEARVPHEWVLEMEDVNDGMGKYDVVLVLGANDVVNSAAQEEEGCAIWGMPVIEVWNAKKVIFCKRSMGGGYADLENPVFFKPNTEMLLGDGKKTADGLVAKVRELCESKA
jgi:NAD(P) transhydrogenase